LAARSVRNSAETEVLFNRKAIGLRVWRTRGPMGLRLNEQIHIRTKQT
jgi:hypothetical protein